MTCVGTPADCPVTGGIDTYSLPGGQVIPGVINVGTSLGLYEVDSESSSADGYIFPASNENVHAAVRTQSHYVIDCT